MSVLCNFVLALHDDGDNEGGHAIVVGDFECVLLGTAALILFTRFGAVWEFDVTYKHRTIIRVRW